MHDVEHNDPLSRWLVDDLVIVNAVFLVAASSLAIALTSCIWHHIHPELPSQGRPTILNAALTSLRISAPRTATTATSQQVPSATSSLAIEQRDPKSTRSKERRRRGKDPFRDLLKGGKRSRALLKALKVVDPPSADMGAPGNDTVSSTSRSPSPEPEPATDLITRLPAESDDGDYGRETTPSLAAVTPLSTSDDGLDGNRPRSDCTSMTVADMQVNVSSASTVIPEDAPSSPSLPADPPRNSQAPPTSGSCANFVRARTRLRVSKIDAGVTSSLLLSALPDSVASPSSLHSTSNSTNGPGPSTPTNSMPLQCPSEDLGQGEQPWDQTASAQLASMRSVLEAARLREDQLRVEAEKASKERDELCWRWNEDADAWRRREAELLAQIRHLMQQLQAYTAVTSFQAPSGFSSPTSSHASPHLHMPFPLAPPIQAQNSASAPAHVQALLASAPMHPFHTGYAAYGGGAPSPLLWSGLGLCAQKWDTRPSGRRTPDSSASGSSSRGRRRWRGGENVQSPSDESSLGDWEGMEDASGDEEEEEEDIFENNALADAILKRPESIRELSGSRRTGRRPERMDTIKDPAHFSPPVGHCGDNLLIP